MSTQVILLTNETPLYRALETFKNARIGGLPVINREVEYVGLLSKSDFFKPVLLDRLAKKEDVTRLPIGEIMTAEDLVLIPPDATVMDAAKIMVGQHLHRVFVQNEEGRIGGVVSSMDVLRLFVDNELDTTTIEPVMTRKLFSVPWNASLMEVCRSLDARKVSGMPVLDEQQRFTGFISNTDLIKFLTDPAHLITLRVREIMRHQLVSLPITESIENASRRMVNDRIHRVFVHDQNHAICGVLSTLDVARFILGPV
ncbi:MAG: CBS domain-containing protein [Candidatus Melainabacteria bacterium]